MHEAIEKLRLKIPATEEGRYLIGLSGGADSVALLLMLLPAVKNHKITLEAVHINHGLRNHESDDDEQFCRELCKKEGIPLYSCRADLSGRTDEAAAREERYALFRKRYTEYEADALILAHHADDQAETFLMRLLRGAGPEGLSCMKADETVGGIRILRPLLSLHRGEIRDALLTDGISWREDSSNRDTAYLRNRIRLELIPAMARISSTAVDKICNAAKLTGEDNRLLCTQAKAIKDRISKDRMVDAETLSKEPAALRRRVLRLWWQEQAPVLKEHALSAVQTEALDRLLDIPGGKMNLPGDMHAVRAGKFLLLTSCGSGTPEPVPVSGPETGFGSFRLSETKSEGNPGDGKRTQEVPPGFTEGCVIRTRIPGDRIRPFGSSGSKKLQDYLTDRRVPEPFRDQIPLLCRGSEVLLVCGVGAGSVPDWNPHSPSVRLTWHGNMPWNE